jgi:O-antigen/teichoic acid export membrane protein
MQDPSGAAAAVRGRSARALLSSVANTGARISALLTVLLTLPQLLEHLGKERFGLWMLVASFTSMLAFADLGIGNGVLNAVARANARGESQQTRRALASGTASVALLALFASTCFLVGAYAVDWRAALHLSSETIERDFVAALTVFSLCFAVNVPLSVITRAQFGLQKGYVVGSWQIGGNLLTALALLAAVELGATLPQLVAVMLGVPLFFALCNACFFLWSHRELRFGPRDMTRSEAFSLVRLGALFFALQLTGALAFSSDNFIVANLRGAAEVADFGIAARVFAVITVVVAATLQPLWPAYADALARHDDAWVRRTVWRSTAAAALYAGVLAVAIVLLFDTVIALWLHRQIDVDRMLIAGLAVWVVIEAVGTSLAMYLNGAHIVRLQLLLAAPFAVSCVLLKVFVVREFGVGAVPWATIATYTPITLIPVLIAVRRRTAARAAAANTALANGGEVVEK